MPKVTLKGYKANDVEYHGHLKNGEKIQLENKFSYNVRYGKEHLCVATLDCTTQDKEDPAKFVIHVVIEGVFAFEDGSTKEELHVLTYKELFPYARALVSSLTAVSGIPPVILPTIDIENQSIYSINTEGLKP